MITIPNYYDVLGLPQHVSKSDIIRAFNQKMLCLNELSDSKEATEERYKQINLLLQSFPILYSNNARASYDKKLIDKNSTEPTQSVSSSYGLIENVIEIFKLRWRYFSIFPTELVVKKIIIDVASRILFSCIGALLGALIIIGGDSNIPWGPIVDTKTTIQDLKAVSIVFAIIFLFAREIYLAFKYR